MAWEQVDSQRWLLADDYGKLFLLMLVLDSDNQVESWKLDRLGSTSRASVLVYLGGGIIFVGSHQGDSQVLQIGNGSIETIQTLSNIAPILDFTVMDLGNRSSESQTHEFSSGQARIITGSGAFDDGTLRSVRSGVGMEELGVLGEMEHITDLWGLQVGSTDSFLDTLVVTFVDETRVFHFSPDGEVEELDHFLGLSLSENTLLVANLPQGRILQVTERRALIADIEGGMVTFEWTPPDQQMVTAASSNEDTLVLITGGRVLTTLAIGNNAHVTMRKDMGAENQISGVTVPPSPTRVCVVGFPQSARVSVLALDDLEELHTKSLGPPGEAFPRSVLIADVLANSPPTLFVSMADGSVITFFFDLNDFALASMNKLVLGSEQPTFKKLPRGDGLYNVFATCENPSLIYGSEGRIIYSAVNSEGASRVCHFNSAAYPESIAVATSQDLKIGLVDKERTTQLQTLPIGATVRRVAYSPTEKAFGIGTIERKLENGAEVVNSQFVLADEILFRRLDSVNLRKEELIESVIRAEFSAGKDESGRDAVKDRFVVGTAYLDNEGNEADESIRGRILVFEVDNGRKLTDVAELPVKGACRALTMLGERIVAALVKTVSIVLSILTCADLSGCCIQTGQQQFWHDETGKARQFQDVDRARGRGGSRRLYCCGRPDEEHMRRQVQRGRRGSPGLADRGISALPNCLEHGGFLRWREHVPGERRGRKPDRTQPQCQRGHGGGQAATRGDKRDLTGRDGQPHSARQHPAVGERDGYAESILGNRRTPVPLCRDAVTDRQQVEGSIYLFAVINSEHQDFLMRLQATMAEYVESMGQLPFNKFRGFRSMAREADEPFRFVDGELIERFLGCDAGMQEKIVQTLGAIDVEQVKGMIEGLRRLH